MPQALPANPDLDWLKKAAKKRLVELRVAEPGAKLHQAQLAVARDHGFTSWRALKAHLDEINGVTGERERVFAAARDGDVEAVRRAFASGFDPATQDRGGRTIYQIAKELRHGAIEILAQDIQGGRLYPEAEQDKVQAIATAAQSVDVAALRELLDANPELIDALAGRHLLKAAPLHLATIRNRHGAMRLLIERGADANATDATGATALTTASQERADPAVISALAAAGTKLDLLTAINTSRFDEAEAMLRENPDRIGLDGADTIALHLAVNKNNLPALRWLLAHGVAVNAKRMMWDCNHTALHMTVENGAMDIARQLLDAGADPNIRDDKFDATALGWAEHFGRPDFVELIRARGGA